MKIKRSIILLIGIVFFLSLIALSTQYDQSSKDAKGNIAAHMEGGGGKIKESKWQNPGSNILWSSYATVGENATYSTDAGLLLSYEEEIEIQEKKSGSIYRLKEGAVDVLVSHNLEGMEDVTLQNLVYYEGYLYYLLTQSDNTSYIYRIPEQGGVSERLIECVGDFHLFEGNIYCQFAKRDRVGNIESYIYYEVEADRGIKREICRGKYLDFTVGEGNLYLIAESGIEEISLNGADKKTHEIAGAVSESISDIYYERGYLYCAKDLLSGKHRVLRVDVKTGIVEPMLEVENEFAIYDGILYTYDEEEFSDGEGIVYSLKIVNLETGEHMIHEVCLAPYYEEIHIDRIADDIVFKTKNKPVPGDVKLRPVYSYYKQKINKVWELGLNRTWQEVSEELEKVTIRTKISENEMNPYSTETNGGRYLYGIFEANKGSNVDGELFEEEGYTYYDIFDPENNENYNMEWKIDLAKMKGTSPLAKEFNSYHDALWVEKYNAMLQLKKEGVELYPESNTHFSEYSRNVSTMAHYYWGHIFIIINIEDIHMSKKGGVGVEVANFNMITGKKYEFEDVFCIDDYKNWLLSEIEKKYEKLYGGGMSAVNWANFLQEEYENQYEFLMTYHGFLLINNFDQENILIEWSDMEEVLSQEIRDELNARDVEG